MRRRLLTAGHYMPLPPAHSPSPWLCLCRRHFMNDTGYEDGRDTSCIHSPSLTTLPGLQYYSHRPSVGTITSSCNAIFPFLTSPVFLSCRSTCRPPTTSLSYHSAAPQPDYFSTNDSSLPPFLGHAYYYLHTVSWFSLPATADSLEDTPPVAVCAYHIWLPTSQTFTL